ncbi:hypothetical protein [Methanolobus psychrotolerans]|uniref:hypothetical protein n=1 Tax=Methanolobus psychrotolerans TaxID=1874706 RepID=UPI000B918D00|nr:hypothetical protein [Methanolobus psychrotolerans]
MVVDNSSVEEIFEIYRDVFVPAYADLVGYIGNKPVQITNELDNTLAHVSHIYNPDYPDEKRLENLQKAKNHLTRATLDSYKLLWVEMKKELDLVSDDRDLEFFINVPEHVFIKEFEDFKTKAQDARNIEMRSVGNSPFDAVEAYKETIRIGKRLLGYIDTNKACNIQKFRTGYWLKENALTILLSFLAGYAANYFWNLFN